LQLVGKYGLKNKREVWRVHLLLCPSSERQQENFSLLKKKTPEDLFEGAALLRRMHRYGLLTNEELKLDYVLGLTLEQAYSIEDSKPEFTQDAFHAKSSPPG
jgi:small subunit ribosomal protein S9e